MTRRLAAVDLGTNTVRLLVADADPRRGIVPRHAEQAVVRLGAGVAARGALDPAAVDRTLATLRRYRDVARALGAPEVLVVATAAVRTARDGPAFLAELRTEPGVSARVVSGDEEGQLALLGVLWGLGVPSGPFVLLDIGGGSTELVVARGARILLGRSLALGVVALGERYCADDPPDAGRVAACLERVAARLEAEAWPTIRPLGPTHLVVTAGTATTLAALDLGLEAYEPDRIQGHRLSLAAVDRLAARLAALPLAERARLPGLEPGRADVIVPGALVLRAALAGLGLPAATVADSGLREGILLDAVGWRPPEAADSREGRASSAP